MPKLFVNIFSGLLIFFASTCVAFALNLKDLKITSDKSEYDKTTGLTTYSGHVTYELETKKLRAKKLVVMTDANGTITKMRVAPES